MDFESKMILYASWFAFSVLFGLFTYYAALAPKRDIGAKEEFKYAADVIFCTVMLLFVIPNLLIELIKNMFF